MAEYGYEQNEPSELENDCDPAITIINGNGPMSALRYLDVDARFAQEAREEGIIKMVKKDSENLSADLLTKTGLTIERFHRHRKHLQGIPD